MEKVKQKNIAAGSLMGRRCLYAGSRDFLLTSSGIREVEAGKTGWAPIMIIGREYYFETVKDFPMSSAGEVRAAVMMDIAAHCPFAAGTVLVKKIASREGTGTFNLWFLKPQVMERIEDLSPWIMIPETALPACRPTAAETLYRFPRAGEDGLLLLRVNGRGESRSLLLPAAVADGDNFSRSLGTRPDAEVKTFTALSDYLGFLHSALAGCRLPQLLPFVNRGWATATRVKKPFYRCTAAAIFIFCLYLGLAFFIPYSAEKGLKRENQALNARLSGLLQQRRQLDNLRRQQQQLAGTVNNYSSKIALFQLLAQALPPRTVIRQLNLSGNTVEISGLSPQASQLLSSLSQKPEISEARFSSPLREDRQSGMERFALMFRFSRKVE